MAQPTVKISSLTTSGALADADAIPVVQGGVTKKALMSAIWTYILGKIGLTTTAWASYTISTPITNMPGSWSGATWRLVNGDVEIRATYTLSGAVTETPGIAITAFNPSTYSLTGVISSSLLGTDTGANYYSGAYTGAYLVGGTGGWGATVPFTWGNADSVYIYFKASKS